MRDVPGMGEQRQRRLGGRRRQSERARERTRRRHAHRGMQPVTAGQLDQPHALAGAASRVAGGLGHHRAGAGDRERWVVDGVHDRHVARSGRRDTWPMLAVAAMRGTWLQRSTQPSQPVP